MTPFLLLLACTPTDDSSGSAPRVDTSDTSHGTDTSDTSVSTLPDTEPLADVDVLVIGSGAGGLGAGWAAKDAGASVLVIERAEMPGGATVNAGNYWAAGTSWQAAMGVSDSPAQALAEWNEFTGGDASSEVVQAFVAESAGVLDWLVGLGGGFVLASNVAADSGTLPREHQPGAATGAPPPVNLVAATLRDELMLQTTATQLILDGDSVAGAWVTDSTGAVGWIHAHAVVVATGGFTRNDAIVLEAIPELAALPTWYESFPGMDGNGLVLMQTAGGATQNMDHLGLYAHGVEDAKVGQPEVMVIAGLDNALVVDGAGHRVADEREFGSVSMGLRYLTEGPFYAVFDDTLWSRTGLQGRGFNYLDDPEDLQLTAVDYEARHAVTSGDDGLALGSSLGVDGDAFQASLDAYNADAFAGVDSTFGKPSAYLSPLVTPPLRALPLVLARSKSFGGIATNADGAVVDSTGAVIPGLYASGEACGFLGSAAIGHGFNGSVTSAWWSGLRAGRAAAE